MIIDLGILGLVEMDGDFKPSKWEQGFVTHSGYTSQGIRVHLFKSAINQGWEHGELWNKAIMLDYYVAADCYN